MFTLAQARKAVNDDLGILRTVCDAVNDSPAARLALPASDFAPLGRPPAPYSAAVSALERSQKDCLADRKAVEKWCGLLFLPLDSLKIRYVGAPAATADVPPAGAAPPPRPSPAASAHQGGSTPQLRTPPEDDLPFRFPSRTPTVEPHVRAAVAPTVEQDLWRRTGDEGDRESRVEEDLEELEFDASSSPEDEDADETYSEASYTGQKRRAALRTRPASRKSRRMAPDDEEEDFVDASVMQDPGRNASPGPSHERRASPPVPRATFSADQRRAPSPSVKPSPALVNPALPAPPLNPFDSTTYNLPIAHPAEAVRAVLDTQYRRHTSGGIGSDIGGNPQRSVGQHLCLMEENNHLPTSAGHPLFVLLLAYWKIAELRKRLVKYGSSISLFVKRRRDEGWKYYGEVTEVKEKSYFLRGGAPFRALPVNKQTQWVDLLNERINPPGKDKKTEEKRQKALRDAQAE
ncbi:hypothetical protein JCM8547_002569 [Rhodosporidiobolus lusitaniae]